MGIEKAEGRGLRVLSVVGVLVVLGAEGAESAEGPLRPGPCPPPRAFPPAQIAAWFKGLG